jgi:hypothetical protein
MRFGVAGMALMIIGGGGTFVVSNQAINLLGVIMFGILLLPFPMSGLGGICGISALICSRGSIGWGATWLCVGVAVCTVALLKVLPMQVLGRVH